MVMCADHHQERASEEMRAFQENFADLFEGIQEPVSLSLRLFSAGLLYRDTRRTICSLEKPVQQRTELLDAVERQITLDPQNFYKFVDELEKDSPMQHLCDKLRSTCAIRMPPTKVPPFSSSSTSCKNKTPKSRIPRLVTPVTIWSTPNTSAVGVPPTACSSSVMKQKSTISRIPQPVILPPNTSAQQIREHDTMLPSFSSSSSYSVTRSQYRVFLKDCYRQPLPDDDKLLTTASKHYIELAVISREDITRKEADEFTNKSLHGLTEEILRKKTPIALEDILKPREDGKPVRCVLVEGAPGIGKSTLAWEVCHKWEKLDSVKQYELVVLIQLREKKCQEARRLEDLLPCDYDTINIKELVTSIGRGNGVLLLCDGFDELPCKQRQEDSVYIKLLKGRLLPEAAIIITSRPSVSADLWSLCQHNIDRHLEVIGFAKRDIKRFAESVFSGDILEGFLSYITSNPPIYSMMYIPLNAVIVALIYKDSYDTDTPFPTTMTQLFDALTRALIYRHLISIQYEFRMPLSLRCMKDINKLPPLVAQQLLELARVAYKGVVNETYVFTDLGEDFDRLGIMKKTTSLNVFTGRECSYTFLHLTLQEYMAALYIANVCPSDLIGPKLYQLAIRFNMVMRFSAGMCRGYEGQNTYYEHLENVLYCIVCHGIMGTFNTYESIELLLVQCTYECPRVMLGINADNIYGYHCVEPEIGFDWYVTGYCISHFDLEWGLSTRYATDEYIDLLVKGLRSSSSAKGKIRTLHVFSSINLSRICRLREFCQLHTLWLFDLTIDEDDEVDLCQLIELESELRKVVCRDEFFSSGVSNYSGTGSFIQLLLSRSSLKELTIWTNRMNINTDLLPQSNANLEKLTIRLELIEPLATILPNMSSLTYLEILGVGLRDNDLSVLIASVQSLQMSTLEVLELVLYSCPVVDLSELVKAACNSKIKELRLQQNYWDKVPQEIRKQCSKLLMNQSFGSIPTTEMDPNLSHDDELFDMLTNSDSLSSEFLIVPRSVCANGIR